MMLYRVETTSPIGVLTLFGGDAGLRMIRLPLPLRAPTPLAGPGAHPVLDDAIKQLHEYFTGARDTFDLPLDPVGSPFQRQVWQALNRIPYGQKATYAEVAVEVGRPGAARAVGGANGRNPLPVVVPCHRVVGSSGALTGYGGPHSEGIAMKRWLLDHEQLR
ncbi:MAG: methylated-DNA--[protein]-cysteine S-methyltransferase [Actinomycetota bacterium]